MQNNMDQKELEKKLKELQTDYKTILNTEESVRVISNMG